MAEQNTNHSTKHIESSSHKSTDKKHKAKGLFHCTQCDLEISTSSAYERHILQHTGEKSFVCEICNKQFNRKGNLTVHQKIHANLEKNHECSVCDSKFYSSSKLKNHMKQVHVQQQEKCDICGRTYKNIYNLRAHISNSHSGKAPVECDFCGSKFQSHRSLERHKVLHTDKLPFKCDHCQEKFQTRSRRATHISSVHCKETFICEACGMHFNSKTLLTSHIIRKHGNHKARECPICKKVVSSYYNHLRMHRCYDKGDVFTCNICAKTFPMKGYLHQHMTVHKEKKFKCEKCGKLFSFNASLQIHLKSCKKGSTSQSIPNEIQAKPSLIYLQYSQSELQKKNDKKNAIEANNVSGKVAIQQQQSSTDEISNDIEAIVETTKIAHQESNLVKYGNSIEVLLEKDCEPEIPITLKNEIQGQEILIHQVPSYLLEQSLSHEHSADTSVLNKQPFTMKSIKTQSLEKGNKDNLISSQKEALSKQHEVVFCKTNEIQPTSSSSEFQNALNINSSLLNYKENSELLEDSSRSKFPNIVEECPDISYSQISLKTQDLFIQENKIPAANDNAIKHSSVLEEYDDKFIDDISSVSLNIEAHYDQTNDITSTVFNALPTQGELNTVLRTLENDNEDVQYVCILTE